MEQTTKKKTEQERKPPEQTLNQGTDTKGEAVIKATSPGNQEKENQKGESGEGTGWEGG